MGTIVLKRITLHECHAELDYTEVPILHDRLQEQIYDISRRSLILNTQAQIYDCNTREHGSYWGDGIWTSEMVGHLTGNFSYMKQFCYAMEDEMPDDRIINASLVGLGGVLLDYSLIPPILMNRYYKYSADRETVERRLPVCEKILGAFRNLKDDSGFITRKNLKTDRSVNLFLDHSGMGWHPRTTVGIDRDDYNAGINLFYLLSLMSVQSLYESFGMKKNLSDEIAKMRKLIKDCFYDTEKGLVIDSRNSEKRNFGYSQITNALAVLTSVVEGDEAQYLLRQVSDIQKNTWIAQGTPYTYFYLFDAMIKMGMQEEALKVSKQYWQPMIDRQATTTWEAFNDECHDSLNHAWSAPLLYLMYSGVCGIKPLKEGYSEMGVKPVLTAFDVFNATFTISQGKVSISWKKVKRGVYDMNISIPEGVEGIWEVGKNTERFK